MLTNILYDVVNLAWIGNVLFVIIAKYINFKFELVSYGWIFFVLGILLDQAATWITDEVVAACLMEYFKELPEPLIPHNLYQSFISAISKLVYSII